MIKKRICMVALRHSYVDSRVFYKEAKTLQGAGHDVTIIGRGEKNTERDGITLVACNALIDAAQWLWKKEFDVYHVHDQSSLLLGIFFSSCKKVPLVYDIHEHYFLFPNMHRGVKKWIVNLLYTHIIEPMGLARAALCIGVTEVMRAWYEPKVKKFVLVPNYYAGALIPASAKKVPSNNQITLLYQGGMKEERGIYRYVDLVKRLRETFPLVRLHCIGPFVSPEEKKQFLHYVHTQHLDDAVRYTESVPFYELSRYTAEADIGLNFLSDTLNNNVGIQNKIFEYFAHGLPVVSTDNVLFFTEQIVPTGAGAVVSFTDTNEQVRVFSQMITHIQEYRDAVYRTREQYRWDTVAPTLVDSYTTL